MAGITAAKLRQRAKKAAGNWMFFENFAWRTAGKLERPQDWTIVYTRQRGSDVLQESNAAVVDRELAPFLEGEDPDVLVERHRHWAVGWAEGYAIRVYRGKRITPAFRTWCRIEDRLRDCPVLDEEDYSRRCYAQAVEAIRQEGERLIDGADLPEIWAQEVYRWLWEHRPEAIEDHAAGCGFSEEVLAEALRELGYLNDSGETDHDR